MEWEVRSLQAFADQSLAALSRDYDLLVIDHPHVGEASRERYLRPLDEVLPSSALERLRDQSVGPSHDSYTYAGHQWALAIDAAAQVAAYRPDRVATPPRTWPEVLALAAEAEVLWPLKPVDAMCSFLTLVASAAPCPMNNEQLLQMDVAGRAVELMRAAVRLIPERCLSMDPVAALEELAEGGAAYSPLLFGYTNYARAGFRGNRVRFADFPTRAPDLRPAGSILGGAGIAVSRLSPRPQEAAAHALWLADAEVQTSTYVENGGQPGNRLAWSDPALDDMCGGFFSGTQQTHDLAWVRPRHPGFVTFQTEGSYIIHEALRGDGPPENVVQALNKLYRGTLS